ncbi:MAG TPA: hypothetical protein VFS47_10215 [Steroidobacteraceae bacterium]|nr:hypothetical protein [Steroidobacteraceae bacterium]
MKQILPRRILLRMSTMCFGLLMICTAGSIHASENASQSEPLYIYSFTGNPSVEHNLGVLPDILMALGEIPNKPLKQKMDAILSHRNREDRFREAFGCMPISEKPGGCSKIEFLSAVPFEGEWKPSSELLAAMQRDAVQTAWVLHVTEQFHVGGYFLSATATKIYSDANDKQKRARRVNAMYWTCYSKELDALRRSIDVKQKGVTPAFGSKEALAAFWYEGNPSRLESEIDKSPAALADMLSVLMTLPLGSRTVSPPEQLTKLPKLRTLDRAGVASCGGGYCSTWVRQEFPERILVEADWQGRPWLLSLPRWEK